MTTCGDTSAKLSALLDNESPEDEANDVREHLAACKACQKEWRDLQSVDQQLKGLLTIDKVQEKVVSISHTSQVRPANSDANHRSLLTWTSIIAAIAAVIVVAFFATRNPVDEEPAAAKPPIAARLVTATGPIEILPPDTNRWITAEPIEDYAISEGARLKTGEKVLCEFKTTKDAKFRVNEAAEIVVRTCDRVELLRGQLWCLAPEDSGIDVQIPLQDEPMPKIATLRCPSAAEIQCVAGESFVACNSVSPANPPAQLAIGTFSCPVAPGETVSIDAEQNIDRKTDLTANKVWQLPLLAVGHRINDELIPSISELLAPVGMTKARHLNETQIRSLGPNGALPLLAYVQSESSPDQLGLRRTAIKIAADLADEKSIDLLQKLTSDPDPYISRRADEALKKIAQQAN